MAASEFEKTLVTNIELNDLLKALAKRADIDKLIKMLRDGDEYIPMRDYMKVPEFARYLKCTENYVRDLARKAEQNKWFAVDRVGSKFRIDRISYEKWKEAGKPKTKEI